jgi:hypothetical protein
MQLIIENGLTPEQALHALTLQPAKLLGIDKKCGSIETGKMANMVLTQKPLFEKESAIRFMLVEGNLYEYEAKDATKKSSKSKVDEDVIAGTWNFTIETPDMKREGTLEFVYDKNEFTGTLKGKNFTGGNNELEGIVVTDQSVSFTYDLEFEGRMLQLEFDLEINEESFEGKVTASEFGSFPITGNRISKPE